ncbi:MAG: Do family serine endopeptidase [Solirubrobacterales bacterium]
MRMKVLRSLAAAVLLTVSLPAAAEAPATSAATVAPIVKRVTPAVVNISTRTVNPQADNPLLNDPVFRHFFNIPQQQRETRAAGSGVIVDAKRGLILTNNHVVEGADVIDVVLKDKRTFRAKLVGRDEATDIAVLRIPASDLTDIPFGESRKVEVGDFVLAVGNPFGLGQTVTSGIVSAIGRSGLGIEGYEDFIQTDASINPGNSGGALVNFNGELIGINTAILAPGGGNIGIGFAVPIDMARAVMTQLVEHGEIRRGRVGIAIQDLTPDLASALGVGKVQGAAVVGIDANSAAARAGLKQGDVITAVDGQPIQNATELRNRIGLMRAGGTAKLTVQRGGREQTIDVRVEEARE